MQIRYVLDTITHLNDGSAALVAFSEAEALFPTHPLQHFAANITAVEFLGFLGLREFGLFHGRQILFFEFIRPRTLIIKAVFLPTLLGTISVPSSEHGRRGGASCLAIARIAAAAMLAPPRFQIASMEIRFFVVPNKEWWSGEKNQFNIDLKLLPHFVRLPDCQFHVQGRTGETNGKASKKASIS